MKSETAIKKRISMYESEWIEISRRKKLYENGARKRIVNAIIEELKWVIK